MSLCTKISVLVAEEKKKGKNNKTSRYMYNYLDHRATCHPYGAGLWGPESYLVTGLCSHPKKKYFGNR